MGQSCNDPGKLSYSPGVGQLGCNGATWVPAVEPTIVRDIGTRCAVSDWDLTMAASPDGYLIWCPMPAHVWTVFRQ